MSSTAGTRDAAAGDQLLHPAARRLEGKVALITGGASGIGKRITRLFWSHGAKVCVLDIQDDRGQRVCQSLGGGASACFLHGDVTKEDDVARAVDLAVERYGKLDIMFKRVVDVNLFGVFLGIKHAARVMIPQAGGSIISLASVAGVIGHAVVGMTRSAAAELGKHGIRVNCISPYGVVTELAMGVIDPAARDGIEDGERVFNDFMGSRANLKGVTLTAGEVAAATLFLAGDDSRYVSGLNLLVDGGFTCVNHSMGMFR
ncbi:unnamed protein product [Spirodela intermedia]|uniref:Uncharacterized protein n=1 Tax=Spirodela intermedia TaxID=51605 RepID=A0A7I8JFT9_SPIIN|nr:unnamed protein product [Spirodela intermedia]CAA6669016.1 unnamed protein product [Spirodela intermedia]